MIYKLVEEEANMGKLVEYIHKGCQSSRETIEKALEGTLDNKGCGISLKMMAHFTQNQIDQKWSGERSRDQANKGVVI